MEEEKRNWPELRAEREPAWTSGSRALGNRYLVVFPEEEVTLCLQLQRLRGHHYRLLDVPVGIEGVRFGDVIEAVPSSDGLRFLQVVRPSEWVTIEVSLDDWETMEAVLRVTETGRAAWRPIGGNRIAVCVPPGQKLDRGAA